jgi:hypothetical protein
MEVHNYFLLKINDLHDGIQKKLVLNKMLHLTVNKL